MSGRPRHAFEQVGATRRDVLVAGAGLAAAVSFKASAAPLEGEVAAAVAEFTRNAAVGAGGLTLSLPALVEDGDHAPLSIDVEGSGRARRLGVFSSGNPLPLVAVYRFGQAAAPRVSTNIRLWRTQTVTAVAEFEDGSFRSASAEVSVSLPACRSE